MGVEPREPDLEDLLGEDLTTDHLIDEAEDEAEE